MASATGRFEVASGSEDAYHEREGDPKLTRATGTQRFAGDIEGEGSVEWVMCYLPDGTARFAGLQRVEGSIGERTGSFVMESVGGQLKSSLDLPTPDGWVLGHHTAPWSLAAGCAQLDQDDTRFPSAGGPRTIGGPVGAGRRPLLAVKREAYRRATFGARVAGYVVTRINRSRRRGRGSKGNTAQPVGTPST